MVFTAVGSDVVGNPEPLFGNVIPKPWLARFSTEGCDRAACVFKASYQMFPQVSTAA